MAGSAILDPTVLIDALVTSVIDPLRRSLHPKFGVRAYKAFLVTRTWSGLTVGQGTKADVELEIDPQPLVKRWDGHRYVLEPCGIDELGEIVLTEVSLTYTYAELTGRPVVAGVKQAMPKNQQFLIRLTEAHGQADPDAFFTNTKPPYKDREDDMGWVMWLRRSKG